MGCTWMRMPWRGFTPTRRAYCRPDKGFHMRAFTIAAFCLAAQFATHGAWAQAQQQEPPLSAWATPQSVARTFQQACVATGGDESAAVDWALSQGFEPAEAMRGNVDGLLSGQPG